MQAAGDGHHQVGKAGLEVPENIAHDPAPFDARQRVFHHHPATRQGVVRRHGRRMQFSTARLFRGQNHPGPRWLPTLETAVTQHQRPGRQIRNGFGQVFVVPTTGRGAGEKLHPPGLGHHHVFYRVPFLFPRVVPPLPPFILGPTNGALRAVNHRAQFGTGRQQLRQLPGVAGGQRQLATQGFFQHRGQAQPPAVGLRLGQAKAKPLDFLDGIVPEVKQDEQQALFRGGENGLGPRAARPLAGLARAGAPGVVIPRLAERLGQGGEFGRIQTGQGWQYLRLRQRSQHTHERSLLPSNGFCLLRIESSVLVMVVCLK
jgi:hypothetical protein